MRKNCTFPDCDCGVDFTMPCPKEPGEEGHADHKIIYSWHKEDFTDSKALRPYDDNAH